MARFVRIVLHQIKMLLNNKITLASTIVVPIVFTLLFSSISDNSERTLYILDYDNSVTSQKLISFIDEDDDIATEVITQEDLDKELDEQKSIMALKIEKDFDRELQDSDVLKLKMIKNYESSDNITLEQAVLSKVTVYKQLINSCDLFADELLNISGSNKDRDELYKEELDAVFDEWKEEPIQSMKYSTVSDNEVKVDWAVQSSVGFLMFFLCMVALQGLGTFIEERENKTFFRFLTTPTKYNRIVIGKAISIFITGVIQLGVLYLVGHFILKIKWFSYYLDMIPLILIYLLCIIFMEMVIISFMRNQRQLNTVSTLVIVISCMIGGTFFPIEIGPEMVQKISMITPQHWVMNGCMDIILNGNTMKEQANDMFVLIGMCAVYLVLAIICMNQQIEKQRN